MTLGNNVVTRSAAHQPANIQMTHMQRKSIQLTDPDYCKPDTPPDKGSKPDMSVRELGPLQNRRNPKRASNREDK